MSVTGKHGDDAVTLSAYDIPRFVELRLDRAKQNLEIVFGYVDTEESARQRVGQDFSVLVGINSGKVLGFEIQKFNEKSGAVMIQLVQALESRMNHAPRINQRLNSEAVRDAVRDRGSRIEQYLAMAY